MTYSPAARRAMNSTSPELRVVNAIELTHSDLIEPLRVVNDTVPCVLGGKLFQAYRFEISRPDNKAQQIPGTRVAITNIGRDLTQWLEASNGGKGAKLRYIQALLDEPPVIEFEITMDLNGMTINNETVTGDLGFKDSASQAAVAVRYDPFSSPPLF